MREVRAARNGIIFGLGLWLTIILHSALAQAIGRPLASAVVAIPFAIITTTLFVKRLDDAYAETDSEIEQT
jgi:hypothetical protein